MTQPNNPADDLSPIMTALGDAIMDQARARVAAVEGETGQQISHLTILINHDTGDVGAVGTIRDHDVMADAMSDMIVAWIEEGLCAEFGSDTDDDTTRSGPVLQ